MALAPSLFLIPALGVAPVFSLGLTPGVTDNSILIGSCSALDGPARFLGNQTVLGATTYLHSINDQGGIFGRKVQLLAFDDGYDPDKAPACFRRMTKEGVFALGFFVGTPTAKVYVPMAEQERFPWSVCSPVRKCCTRPSSITSSMFAPLITMRRANRSKTFGASIGARSE